MERNVLIVWESFIVTHTVLTSRPFLGNDHEEGELNTFPRLKYYPASVSCQTVRLVVRKSFKLSPVVSRLGRPSLGLSGSGISCHNVTEIFSCTSKID